MNQKKRHENVQVSNVTKNNDDQVTTFVCVKTTNCFNKYDDDEYTWNQVGNDFVFFFVLFGIWCVCVFVAIYYYWILDR